MKWVAVVMLAAFLAGCLQTQTPAFVCNAPYILVGTSCCLDQNGNEICDSDETKPQAPTPSASPRPSIAQTQGNGPWNDKTYIAFSQDGKNWQPGPRVAEQASVPGLLRLEKPAGAFEPGGLLIYYVDFSQFITPGSENIRVLYSSDQGKTWTDQGVVAITGKQNAGAAVDPGIVQLEDGRIRLYFFGSEVTTGDPARAEGKHKVYSAVSTDGISFAAEPGTRFEDEGLTDPDVIEHNGQWLMYYSVGQATELAVSDDGLTFTARSITGGNLGGVPSAISTPDGVRLFACGMGIQTAFAPDATTFTKEQGDIFQGQVRGVVCDPDVVRLSDGSYAMTYKVNNATGTLGSPPNGLNQPAQGAPPGGKIWCDGVCDDVEKSQGQNSPCYASDCLSR
ncbi:exo-alpha-sialidase [Candidatus Micrarchaeota archaeon]|nr:exo-alpha-sialidase [Candidatus Micrarchaeota archaeon]